MGSCEKFADAMQEYEVVGRGDIIGNLADKRFHNSISKQRKLTRSSDFMQSAGRMAREKGDQKSNMRSKKLEFGVGLA